MNDRTPRGEDPYAWVYLIVLGATGAAMTVVSIVEFARTMHWQYVAFVVVGVLGIIAAYHVGRQIRARKAADRETRAESAPAPVNTRLPRT